MTAPDYTALCAQGEAAMEGTTDGPWTNGDTRVHIGFVGAKDVDGKAAWGGFDLRNAPNAAANARFIAWARNNVSALIAAIRELEARNRDLALDALASLGQAQEAYEAQLAAEATVATLTAQVEALEWFSEISAEDALAAKQRVAALTTKEQTDG